MNILNAKKDLESFNEKDLRVLWDFYDITKELDNNDKLWLLALEIHRSKGQMLSAEDILKQGPVLESLFRTADFSSIIALCGTNKNWREKCKEPLNWEGIIEKLNIKADKLRTFEPYPNIIEAAFNAKSTIAEAFIIAYLNKIGKPPDPVFLLEAASRNYPKLTRYLLNKGIDPNVQVKRAGVLRWTPLMTASHRGHLEIVKILLKAGSDPNIQNQGRTALTMAIVEDNSEIVKELLKAGADPNVQGYHGFTPLIHALPTGKSEILKELLKAGADPNIKDKYGDTPLMLVSQYRESTPGKYAEIVKILLKAGADIEIQNGFGQTALMFHVIKNNTGIVKELLNAGADLNVREYPHSSTLLMRAVLNNNAEIVKELLKAGTDPNLQNDKGDTALMYAVNSDNFKIVQILLDAGADPLKENTIGDTALTIAEGSFWEEERNKNIRIKKLLQSFITSRSFDPQILSKD